MTMGEALSGDGKFKEWRNNQKRKKQILKSGGGKYSMPVRYKLRKFINEAKEDVGGVFKNIKEARAKKMAMKDASGKTSRNSSATCGPKGCGKIGGKE